MKSYPSIARIGSKTLDQEFYTFSKIDGSNLRFEWSRKTGWYKWGTRTHLFDAGDPIFGSAISLFMDTLAEPLAEIAYNNKWINIVAFAEFWGKNSFAGRHVSTDPKHLTLFDVSIYRRGMLEPKEFLDYFKYLPIPNFIGIQKWDKSFVDRVKTSTVEGISYEGCVGKNDDLTLVKCKTNRWLDEVKRLYSSEEAFKIINS